MVGILGQDVTLLADFGLAYAGLATVGYTLKRGDGTTFQARTTSGVAEVQAGQGIYRVKVAAAVFTTYFSGYVFWDTGGAAPKYAVEELLVHDPLTTIVPGSYAPGSAGAALGRIGPSLVQVVSPIAQDKYLTLYEGDSYLHADGRALVWVDAGGTWPSLAPASSKAGLRIGNFYKEGTILNAGTANQSVRVELTAEETVRLPNREQAYSIVALIAGVQPATLVYAKANVVPRVE